MIEAFTDRQKQYLNQAEKTKSALKEAELALADIKTKLTDLEAGEQKAIENAKREASLAKENLVKEAEILSEKLKKEAEQVIINELAKAKAEISAVILTQAMTTATQKILNSSAQTASFQESNFIKQLEQVNP